MDEWDDFREPTEDERAARRILALAIALINARTPLPTARIRREFYEELSDDAFRRAFLRDRDRLGASGLVVQKSSTSTNEPAWEVDEERSFVRENKLTPEDALFLDYLLLPVAADPTYPYSRDLRLALTKIDRSFDGNSSASIPSGARKRNNNLSRIEECLTLRHAVKLSYTRADGSQLERVVAPLGLFALRGSTYMVAAPTTDVVQYDNAHVYNLDRLKSVKEQKKIHYVLPSDFDVRDFIRLPFQIGPTIYEGTFLVPQPRLQDVRSKVAGSADWSHADGIWKLTCPVASEHDAATWAIAEGVEPLSPPSLRDEWTRMLQAALEGASHEA